MSAKTPALPSPLSGQPPQSDSVSQALATFQSIRSWRLRWALWILPWVVIAVGVYLGFPSDPMFLSGTVAAALSLFAFQHLMQLAPETFGTLWSRHVIAAKSTAVTEDEKSTPNRAPKSSTVNVTEERYRKFIYDLERSLNHPWQRLVGLLFALTGPSWIPIGLYIDRDYWFPYLGIPAVQSAFREHLLDYAFEVVTAYIIGLMAWRMIVIGAKVWQLEKKFDLIPQLEHPDKCGGLQPLGNLCLWNALIVAIPSVFLGGWIIIGPWSPYDPWLYNSFFPLLLILPTAWAIISFVLPLWGVHQTMVAKRAVVWQHLDQLGQHINQLAQKMLDQADQLDPEQNETLTKKLELMRQIYQKNQHYPVWPFDVSIFITFATTQVVPLIGLTGLKQDALNVFQSGVTKILARWLPHG